MPKMLRGVFRHHRELLGGLCRAAWEVVRDLMATAVGDPEFRPGMVSVVQTHGDMLGWHPHLHAIASRGGWAADRSFTPVPFVDAQAAEQVFRHRVITLLRDEELWTEERIELLLSWRHSGFSAHLPDLGLAASQPPQSPGVPSPALPPVASSSRATVEGGKRNPLSLPIP
jgi:hypothetical protein